MKYEFSKCFALQSPRAEEAKRFYNEVIGLELRPLRSDPVGEMVAGDNLLYFEVSDETMGPIFELIVDDIEAARDELLQHGCTVLRWEGVGSSNYIRDPFGFVFNLWQKR